MALQATDETRRYFEQKNYGFSLAKREVVVFLDSDVIPEPGWLEGLLIALRDPAVHVISGNTYIEPDSWYARAFALFWFFPLRQEDAPMARVKGFFANNVAFRREVFASHQFPRLNTFRGHCVELARTLEANGYGIFREPRSRVSHPPPNGFSHFVARAMCQGRDERFLIERFGPATPGHGPAPLRPRPAPRHPPHRPQARPRGPGSRSAPSSPWASPTATTR